ncbi:MAG: hypothetical protein P8L32_00480 [Paracoccaceae bacterium]|jgi:hypothetical protein|nr:hypothetical protein [Paracoccaceae bacterium]
MLPVIVGLLGAVIGSIIARRRKGTLLDILQYAGAFFIAFAIVGLIISVIIIRTA